MDLQKALQELYAEKEKLERVILSLEELQRCATGEARVVKRRGRKFMDAKERQEVSARMKRYWASQRNGRSSGAVAN
jgi:hypothetical protein